MHFDASGNAWVTRFFWTPNLTRVLIPKIAQDAARLFDLFLSSHPLMPLYVGAAAMHNVRSQLLALHEMPELHSFLTNLDLGQGAALDKLALQAIQLIKLAPPLPLAHLRLHELSLSSAVAPAAVLAEGGTWGVPECPPWEALRKKMGGRGRRSVGGPLGLVWRVLQIRAQRDGPGGKKGGLLASTALSLTGIMGVYLVAAVVMTYGGGRQGQGPGGLFASGGRNLWSGLGLFLQL